MSRALEDAAAWVDEEYARLALSSETAGATEGALRVQGALGALADLAAALRAWAATGRPPQHRPVRSLRLPAAAWQALQRTGRVTG